MTAPDAEPSEPRKVAPALGSRKLHAACLAMAVLCFAVFAPSLWSGFVFDDVSLISKNPYAHDLVYLTRGFRTHLWDIFLAGTTGDTRRYYRPLVSASYVLNWVLSGGSAWAFHLFNVLAHVAAGVLALRIATRWTSTLWGGLIAAGIFALHPTRSESVTWISGRTDVMMALFMLLAVELSQRAARSPRHGLLLGSTAVILGVAGVLSKEAGALVPVLVAVDWALAPSGSRQRRVLSRIVMTLAVLSALYIGARASFLPVTSDSDTGRWMPAYGLLTSWAYVERLFVPWPQTFFYRPLIADDAGHWYPPALVVLGILTVVAYCVWIVHSARRDPPTALLLLAAAALLAPVSNFFYSGIPVTVSDRFWYLPILPLACAFLRTLGTRVTRLLEQRMGQFALTGLGLASAGVLWIRTLDYADDETFWRAEHSLHPDHPFVLGHIAAVEAQAGRLDEAYAAVQRGLGPQARRYVLHATATSRTKSYLMGLGLLGALTPDGNVQRLEQVWSELDNFSRADLRNMRGRVEELSVGSAIPESAVETLAGDTRYTILAEAAMVGGRLGHDARVSELVREIPDDRIWFVSNPLNLALTHARIGDFAGARRRAEAIRSPPSGVPAPNAELIADFVRKLDRTEGVLTPTPAGPGAASRALAMAELGAYLRALRMLRPVYEADSQSPGVASLYTELLVAARLDREAIAAAARSLGKERAERTVAGLRAQLSPRLLSLVPPEEPSPWWP